MKTKKIKAKKENAICIPKQDLTRNTPCDNLLYWLGKVIKFWEKEETIDIDIKDPLSVYTMAHQLNMSLNQFIETVLKKEIKRIKNLKA